MSPFEIFLLSPDHQPVAPERVFDAFRAVGWIRQTQADPSRFVYHNLDTGVFMNLWIPSIGSAEPMEESGHEGRQEEGNGDGDEDKEEEEEMKDGIGIGDGEVDGEVEEEEAILPPLTITLPLICPSFFGEEGVEVAESIAKQLGLELAAGDHHSARDEIVADWNVANRAAALQAGGRELVCWAPEESQAWYRYGTGRPALETELAADNVTVPRLQLARHEGRLKTLCTWEEGGATVLPRTDLVLVQRERTRRGLFLTKRVKEEGIVAGERVWKMLAPFSEERGSPAPILVFRPRQGPPQQVAADLEVLELDPVSTARRADLLGVVDFEVPARSEAPT